MNVDVIPHRRSIRMHSGPESQRSQYLLEPPIVATVPGRIERDEARVSFLVDVEPRDQPVRFDLVRRRQRRNEQITERRWIVLASSPACPRPDTAPPPGAYRGADRSPR